MAVSSRVVARTTVVAVDAGHEGDLGPDEYRRCRDLVFGFVGESPPNDS